MVSWEIILLFIHFQFSAVIFKGTLLSALTIFSHSSGTLCLLLFTVLQTFAVAAFYWIQQMVYFIWLVEPDWKQLLEFNNLCIVGQILSQVNKTNTQGEIKLFIFDIEAVIQCSNIAGQAEQVISDWWGTSEAGTSSYSAYHIGPPACKFHA